MIKLLPSHFSGPCLRQAGPGRKQLPAPCGCLKVMSGTNETHLCLLLGESSGRRGPDYFSSKVTCLCGLMSYNSYYKGLISAYFCVHKINGRFCISQVLAACHLAFLTPPPLWKSNSHRVPRWCAAVPSQARGAHTTFDHRQVIDILIF